MYHMCTYCTYCSTMNVLLYLFFWTTSIRPCFQASLTVSEFMGQDSLDGFDRLPFRLRRLVLQKRQIRSVPPGGIPHEGFEQLEAVRIFNLGISSVPNDFFHNVRNSLRFLSVHGGPRSLDQGALRGLHSLKEFM